MEGLHAALLLGDETEERIRLTIAAEAERDRIYFVRVSRYLAGQMADWSGPVRVRFELDDHRDGEGQLIFEKLDGQPEAKA